MVGYRMSTQLLEPTDLILRKARETKVRECIPTPQRERVRKRAAGRRDVATGERALALVGERLEAGDVHLLRLQTERVAAAGRRDHVVAQRLPQPGHVDLDTLGRMLGRLSVPELLHQALDRERPAVVDREECQQRALAAPGDRKLAAVRDDLERPEQSE